MKDLRGRDGLGARALEVLILTAARTSEATGMRWEEIDLAAAVWTVPAARMKLKREHRVPLSPRALALLQERRPRRWRSPAGTRPPSPLSCGRE